MLQKKVIWFLSVFQLKRVPIISSGVGKMSLNDSPEGAIKRLEQSLHAGNVRWKLHESLYAVNPQCRLLKISCQSGPWYEHIIIIKVLYSSIVTVSTALYKKKWDSTAKYTFQRQMCLVFYLPNNL